MPDGAPVEGDFVPTHRTAFMSLLEKSIAPPLEFIRVAAHLLGKRFCRIHERVFARPGSDFGAPWRPRCQSITPISLDYTAAASERFGWIAPTTIAPSHPPVVSSRGMTWSFGRWIDLSSGSMQRQSRCSGMSGGNEPNSMATLVIAGAAILLVPSHERVLTVDFHEVGRACQRRGPKADGDMPSSESELPSFST